MALETLDAPPGAGALACGRSSRPRTQRFGGSRRRIPTARAMSGPSRTPRTRVQLRLDQMEAAEAAAARKRTWRGGRKWGPAGVAVESARRARADARTAHGKWTSFASGSPRSRVSSASALSAVRDELASVAAVCPRARRVRGGARGSGGGGHGAARGAGGASGQRGRRPGGGAAARRGRERGARAGLDAGRAALEGAATETGPPRGRGEGAARVDRTFAELDGRSLDVSGPRRAAGPAASGARAEIKARDNSRPPAGTPRPVLEIPHSEGRSACPVPPGPAPDIAVAVGARAAHAPAERAQSAPRRAGFRLCRRPGRRPSAPRARGSRGWVHPSRAGGGQPPSARRGGAPWTRPGCHGPRRRGERRLGRSVPPPGRARSAACFGVLERHRRPGARCAVRRRRGAPPARVVHVIDEATTQATEAALRRMAAGAAGPAPARPPARRLPPGPRAAARRASAQTRRRGAWQRRRDAAIDVLRKARRGDEGRADPDVRAPSARRGALAGSGRAALRRGGEAGSADARLALSPSEWETVVVALGAPARRSAAACRSRSCASSLPSRGPLRARLLRPKGFDGRLPTRRGGAGTVEARAAGERKEE